MLKLAPIGAAIALITLPLSAAHAQSLNRDPAKVQAGAYVVEPGHTRVLFSVIHMGFTSYYGDFTGVSGALTLDPANPGASSVSVSIPVASVSTTNKILDGELKSAAWFNAAGFPAITFKSTKIVVTGPGTADITGDLTLHGVTKPVTLAAKFNASGANMMSGKQTVGFDATAHFKRSDFGVSNILMAVSDDVDVTISAAFEKSN